MHPDTPHGRARAVIAAVHLSSVTDAEFESSINELKELAKTLGYQVVGTFVQHRAKFDAAAYLGEGKRDEIRRFVFGEEEGDVDEEGVRHLDDHAHSRAVDALKEAEQLHGAAKKKARALAKPAASTETRHADVVLVDHDISPSQARHLEIDVGCEVMDRTMVILEIFHRHASSRAARAQVEIARLHYLAPRLREQAKLAGPQGRQRSGTGGRGAGETQLAMDRQKIRNRIAELEVELAAMEVERKTQRARRQAVQAGHQLARVALVGYTNAGKSTLMRALTGSEVLVANKLFATLDTTVRTLHPETHPRVLVSDTVGFIKNLPHDLVASFKSTLDEAAESSLLLHVIDASDPGFERQREVTDEVLAEIDAGEVPRIRVFNKIDLVGDADAQAAHEAMLREKYPDCVVMSAKRPADVSRLHGIIRAFFQHDMVEAEIVLPWSLQQWRGKIFETCDVLEERAEEEGAVFRLRGPAEAIEALRQAVGA